MVLDLNKAEDNFGEADLPMAIVPQSGRLVLFQMEGHVNREELAKALEMGVAGTRQVYDKMREALHVRYASTPAAEVPA
jgi:exosome complex component RRP41